MCWRGVYFRPRPGRYCRAIMFFPVILLPRLQVSKSRKPAEYDLYPSPASWLCSSKLSVSSYAIKPGDGRGWTPFAGAVELPERLFGLVDIGRYPCMIVRVSMPYLMMKVSALEHFSPRAIAPRLMFFSQNEYTCKIIKKKCKFQKINKNYQIL